MQEGKPQDPGKLTEASLDWKPNAHKCRDRELNPGLIGAKRGKIRYANLLPRFRSLVGTYPSFTYLSAPLKKNSLLPIVFKPFNSYYL